ncbi:hypothetical protein [Metamycoplasma canadense]|uniref:hypothetical protein n=1 Tax=Metamycoplasma canadense TaxID=29554 RepID=UPI00130E65C7|nr:hypothetical protein [Metamycoplasma canadense]
MNRISFIHYKKDERKNIKNMRAYNDQLKLILVRDILKTDLANKITGYVLKPLIV